MTLTRTMMTLLVAVGLLAGAGAEAAPPPEVSKKAALPNVRIGDVRNPPAATYLVICTEAAVEALGPLVARRTATGQRVRLATVESVAKAYADEPARSKRIRQVIDNVRRASAEAKAPLRFVLLVGTANPRHKGNMALPAFATRALYQTTEFPCEKTLVGDYLYAVPIGGRLPDVAVGRLPARSAGEVTVMVRKTLDADTHRRGGLWRRRIRLVAGQGFYGATTDRLLESLLSMVVGSIVPDYLDLSVTYANPTSPYCWPPDRFRSHVTGLMNEGPALLAYVGHGHWQGLSSMKWRTRWYDMFESADVAGVRNPHHRTTVLSICCSTGKLDGPLPSIGERLIASPTGPAAFIGSSGISQPYGNAVLAELAVDALAVHPQATVGEALLEVRRGLATHRVTALRGMVDLLAATQIGIKALPQQRVDQVSLYNLLGDPALPLPVVMAGATVEAPQEAPPGTTITVRATSGVLTGTAHWSMTILRNRMKGKVLAVRADHPQVREEMIRTHKAANDKVLAAGKTPVADGRASWQVRLPGKAPGARVFVSVMIESADAGAAGSATVKLRLPKPVAPKSGH
jgi:peptidase C25-like protein